MFTSLSGYRTYICATVLIVLSALHTMGYIGPETFNLWTSIFGAGGLMALRTAIQK